jgi:hypothetical protein
MQQGQDWCLQCGAGGPGSLSGGPGWRTGVAILAATALLVIGASVAAYAALTKPKPKPSHALAVVRSTTPVPTYTAPGTTTPGSTTPGTPTTVAPSAPSTPVPTPTPAPAPGGSGSEPSEPVFPAETKTGSSTKSKSEPTGGGGGEVPPKEETGESAPGAEPPSPILLDTNAASVYNPYSYPVALFGDPSLTIDGEAKTAWTAQVQSEKAPRMAEGLLLDLKSPQKLGSATVKTATTGASVEVYGANGGTLPTTIADPTWKRLVGLKVLKKKTTAFKLKTDGKSFRYVVLWLVKAPPGSTVASPGHVAIGEFELFPSG